MRHLVLSGTPQERGILHGKTWAKEIHEFATIRKNLLLKIINPKKLNILAETHLDILRNDEELWDEFCGISEAAEISPNDLMILNNYTDFRDFDKGDFDESFFECSCFAFKKNNKILIGQTWDMHASATPYVAHLTVKKENQTQEVFTLTGCLGLTGISTNSFGVFINNLRSRELNIGLAWPALVRKLLDSKSISEAETTLHNNMPSAGRNFLLCDNAEASNFEVTAKQIAREGDLSRGYIFHTNHYVTKLKETEELTTRSQTTLNRYKYLSEKIPELAKENLSVQLIGEKLLNTSLGIISLEAPKDPHGSATCGGLIYDFSQKSGISFQGLYSDNKHLKI